MFQNFYIAPATKLFKHIF